MQTEKYITFYSGEANRNNFTTSFTKPLVLGDYWEVACAQAHLAHRDFRFVDEFKSQFENNPVMGWLRMNYKTDPSDDLFMTDRLKSVHLNDIIDEFSESTSKYDVMKMIYTRIVMKALHSRKNRRCDTRSSSRFNVFKKLDT